MVKNSQSCATLLSDLHSHIPFGLSFTQQVFLGPRYDILDVWTRLRPSWTSSMSFSGPKELLET